MRPEMCKGERSITRDNYSNDTDSDNTILNTAMALLTRDAMCKRGHFGRPVSVRSSVCHLRVLYPKG